MTPKQKQLKAAHGTPDEFAEAVMRAVPEISLDEAATAISKYQFEWDAAGPPKEPVPQWMPRPNAPGLWVYRTRDSSRWAWWNFSAGHWTQEDIDRGVPFGDDFVEFYGPLPLSPECAKEIKQDRKRLVKMGEKQNEIKSRE